MKLFVLLASLILVSASRQAEENWQRLKSALNQLSDVNVQPRAECDEPFEHGIQFDCDVTASCDVPLSVHKLKPGDVKVIGAIGDSITAANGAYACTILQVFTEYRGASWSIGGDNDFTKALTLPNILRLYNPDLIGYSLGNGNVYSNTSYLNCAVPTSESIDMPGQAENLVNRIYADRDIDVNNDWKVITLFIGGNDICEYCKDHTNYTKEKYIKRITQALDHFHEKLPRTFVNVVGLINITMLTLQEEFTCRIVHGLICSCISDMNQQEALETEQLNRDYQKTLEELANSGRYDTTDDFTVVYQPFMEETTFPVDENGNVDKSYMAPDCFHLSAKGHAFAAKELWNNMLQPIGHKSTEWDPFSTTILCPTKETPYFATIKNSIIDVTSTEKAKTTRRDNAITTEPTSETSAVTPNTSPVALVLIVAAAYNFLHLSGR